MRNARGVGDGVERGALFGSAQDDVHDGRRLVGERYGTGLYLEVGESARSGGRIGGNRVAARQRTNRADRHNARHAPRLPRAFVHVIRCTRVLEHQAIGNGSAQGIVAAQDAAHCGQRFEHAVLSRADAGKRKCFHGRS